MNSFSRYFLYLLIAAVICSVPALIVYRDDVGSYLESSAGINRELNKKDAKSSEVVETAVLQDKKFQALTNKVTDFNFDDICKRPQKNNTPAAGPSLSATSTSTSILFCQKGNDLPFVYKK